MRSPGAIKGVGVHLPPGGSHVDLGPTLLEALGVVSENHFFGESLLSASESLPRHHSRRPAFLSQTYDGTHWCSVRWPFKLCRNLHRGTWDPLRNLVTDPLEEHDAATASSEANTTLALLRLDLITLPPLTQRLLESNRLGPIYSTASIAATTGDEKAVALGGH